MKCSCNKLLFVPLLLVVMVAVYLLYLVAVSNFHVVSPGQIYRSGQMSGSALTHVVHEHDIKTILNLRGEMAVAPGIARRPTSPDEWA